MNIKTMKFLILLIGAQNAHGMVIPGAVVAGKTVAAMGLSVATDKVIKTIGNKCYDIWNQGLSEQSKQKKEDSDSSQRTIFYYKLRQVKREFFNKYFGIHRNKNGGGLETLANFAKVATFRGGLDPRLMWFGLVSPETLAAVMLTREIYALLNFCGKYSDSDLLGLVKNVTRNPLDYKADVVDKITLTALNLPVFLPLLFACKKIGIFKRFTNGLPKKISDKLQKTMTSLIPTRKKHFVEVH